MCGGCVRPTLGDTQTQRSCFCLYIYKAILHCNFAVNSGYNCNFAVLRVVVNSGYNCKNITICIFCYYSTYIFYPRQPGSLRPTFSPSIQ